jgi:SpoVK/Ycf46/Vps4 family AAA+-type ATPase
MTLKLTLNYQMTLPFGLKTLRWKNIKKVCRSLVLNTDIVLYVYLCQDEGKCVTMRLSLDNPEKPFSYTRSVYIRPSERNRYACFLGWEVNGECEAICYRDEVEARGVFFITGETGEKIFDMSNLIKALLRGFGNRMQAHYRPASALACGQWRYGDLNDKLDKVNRKADFAHSAREKFADIYLPEPVLAKVIDTMEVFAADEAPVGSILLKGPAGTGKTKFCSNIAAALGAKFIKVSSSQLKTGFTGQSAKAVAQLWEEARSQKPAVIFIDECDGLFARRGNPGAYQQTEEITNAFLSGWTGSEKGIWILGATNRRDMIDDAILSRFAAEVQIPAPDSSGRQAIFLNELKASGLDDPKLPQNLAALTQGLSGRDLAQIARRAAAHRQTSLAQLISESRIGGNPAVDGKASWETLVVSEETMSALKTTCEMLRDAEAWAARGVPVPKGILLEGPPGTGKTQIARTLANESGLSFIAAATAELRGQYLGHSSANVKALFDRARAAAPSIVFIDEIDIVAPARGNTMNDTFSREITGQLLQEIDGIKSSPAQVFVLAATNQRQIIDPAILRRFTESIHVPLPDYEARTRLLRILLSQCKASFSDEDVALLAAHSEGMSGGDLKNWVEKAQQRAVARAIAAGGAEHYSMETADFFQFNSKYEKEAVN